MVDSIFIGKVESRDKVEDIAEEYINNEDYATKEYTNQKDAEEEDTSKDDTVKDSIEEGQSIVLEDNEEKPFVEEIEVGSKKMNEEELQNDERSKETQANLEPTFMNYIKGKLEMNLYVAIDFTSSNGNPTNPDSPHYIHPNEQLNDYESAISLIGGFIAEYDSDKVGSFSTSL